MLVGATAAAPSTPTASAKQPDVMAIHIPTWAAFQALLRRIQALVHQLSLLEQSSVRASWLHHMCVCLDVNIALPMAQHAQHARLVLLDVGWVADVSETPVTKLQVRS